ncbi:MAG TPA: hypothetical protein VIK08_02260 [Candidatus Limnocylindrales bacterium]
MTGVDGGAQIASEPADVADDEHVVPGPRAAEHVVELGGIANGAPAVGDGPGESGIDQSVPLDRPVLLLALCLRSEGVVLAAR